MKQKTNSSHTQREKTAKKAKTKWDRYEKCSPNLSTSHSIDFYTKINAYTKETQHHVTIFIGRKKNYLIFFL